MKSLMVGTMVAMVATLATATNAHAQTSSNPAVCTAMPGPTVGSPGTVACNLSSCPASAVERELWARINGAGTGWRVTATCIMTNPSLNTAPFADVLPATASAIAFTFVGTGGDDVIELQKTSDTFGPLPMGSSTIPITATVNAGAGRDFVFGSISDSTDYAETLNGQDGPDVIFGNAGNDVLTGGDHADYLNGGPGRDTLAGGAGRDVLQGGLDNDNVLGGAGNDAIAGGGDDDVLDGGPGNDRLCGGVADYQNLGPTGLHSEHHGTVGEFSCDQEDEAEQDFLVGGPGMDELFGQRGRDHICGDTGNATAVAFVPGTSPTCATSGGGDDDFIQGGLGADTVYGQLGTDTICAATGDRVRGGPGNDDVLEVAAAPSVVNCNSGNFDVFTTASATPSNSCENVLVTTTAPSCPVPTIIPGSLGAACVAIGGCN